MKKLMLVVTALPLRVATLGLLAALLSAPAQAETTVWGYLGCPTREAIRSAPGSPGQG